MFKLDEASAARHAGERAVKAAGDEDDGVGKIDAAKYACHVIVRHGVCTRRCVSVLCV